MISDTWLLVYCIYIARVHDAIVSVVVSKRIPGKTRQTTLVKLAKVRRA